MKKKKETKAEFEGRHLLNAIKTLTHDDFVRMAMEDDKLLKKKNIKKYKN